MRWTKISFALKILHFPFRKHTIQYCLFWRSLCRNRFGEPTLWPGRHQGLSLNGKKKLFYRIGGEGEALLLLHGFPTSSWDWKDVWETLTRQYKVLTFDYLGFGFSEKPKDGHYSIFQYADQAEFFLQEQGIQKVHLLAHDLGDTVAQELVARFREKLSGQRIGGPDLESVFFLNGGIFPETHRPRAVQKLLNGPFGFLFSRLVNKTSFQKNFSEVFGPNTKPGKEELDGFWECVNNGGGKAIYHKLIRYMRERKFSEIDGWERY